MLVQRFHKEAFSIAVLIASLLAGTIGTEPAIGATRTEWAQCRAAQKNPAVAIAVCTRIIGRRWETKASRAMAYNNRCAAHIARRQFGIALKDCDQAVMLQPRHMLAHWNRGRALFSLGRGKDAIDALTTALRFNPNNYHARFTRGRAYFLTKDYRAAVRAFGRMVRMRPRDYSAHHNRGLA